MKKVMIIALIIVGMILIPSVSAVIYEDDQIVSKEYTKGVSAGYTTGARTLYDIRVYNIQDYSSIKTLYYKTTETWWSGIGSYATNPYYSDTVSYYISGNLVGTGTASYNALFTGSTVTGVQWWFEFDNGLDIGAMTGTKAITVVGDSGPLMNGYTLPTIEYPNAPVTSGAPILFNTDSTGKHTIYGYYLIRCEGHWKCKVESDDLWTYFYRNLDGHAYYSKIVYTSGGKTYSDDSVYDVQFPRYGDSEWSILNPYGRYFNGSTDAPIIEEPDGDASVTVYIKNSQTGALIANSNIVIDALVNGEYYPVVNRTEPSGIFSINLQPTGGGHPNPDGYRLIVTADGYNNPMPEINFTVDDYKQSIYCLLDPIAGGPVDENKTFIDFFVSDRFGNPIPGATVKFGKYTLITNSAGYTVFEVPKNDYYTYTVSKSGYNTLTGNTNIGDAPRNTINTYLTPVTTPPTQPTDWPTTPTPPTGGIPDEDDDSDGFLMQSVRGIANLFGVSFGVGKTILGMLLALGIGTATAKQLKGGAQEFGMGMLGGVVLGVLAGLLPIWVLVLLVLIVGLWIGQRYMSGGDS